MKLESGRIIESKVSPLIKKGMSVDIFVKIEGDIKNAYIDLLIVDPDNKKSWHPDPRILNLDSEKSLVGLSPRSYFHSAESNRILVGVFTNSSNYNAKLWWTIFSIPERLHQDFSEYFIGHSGSTYWTKKESEKAEIFKKIESYLTFLNLYELERQGADIQSKIEELEELNQSFRERDKMKDDAIAHLSDQLMDLTARMQDLERRRQ